MQLEVYGTAQDRLRLLIGFSSLLAWQVMSDNED